MSRSHVTCIDSVLRKVFSFTAAKVGECRRSLLIGHKETAAHQIASMIPRRGIHWVAVGETHGEKGTNHLGNDPDGVD